MGGGPPPPPPPMMMGGGPPPPPFLPRGMAPPPPPMGMSNGGMGGGAAAPKSQPINKSAKTIRLHWRDAAPNMMPTAAPGPNDSLWTSLTKVKLDTDKLAELFEVKQTEVKIKVIIKNFPEN
ncbi:unnamed protein product [Adineta steineri]|uniref:FH2 domain-containing protein n=1 Tax=Adineta steineri TaxID=433720 RepID=A0A815R106_9BILA|nr:unnamed protein product [Adineta steineri]CAF1635377.1 unnamed protein product [Adineta steineri]